METFSGRRRPDWQRKPGSKAAVASRRVGGQTLAKTELSGFFFLIRLLISVITATVSLQY